MRHSTRIRGWILITLSLVSLWLYFASIGATADLDFQSVDERVHFTFSYPDGSPRLISQGNDIQAFNEAWDDTTGRGIPHDYYFTGVNALGDSVGLWVWENLPPGKYRFVERAGVDSIFAAPRFIRLGWDTAPENSVDSAAVKTGHIHDYHLDPDSLINHPKYIKSGVIIDKHVTNVSGAKVLDGTVEPAKLAEGRTWFASSDSIGPIEWLKTNRVSAVAGVLEIVGPTEIYGANDVKSGADITVLSGGSLLANSGSTVTLGTDVTLGGGGGNTLTVNAQTTFQRHVALGDGTTDSTSVKGDLTAHGNVRLYGPLVFKPTHMHRDSSTTQYKVVEIPGVSDIIADGFWCECWAKFSWNEYQISNIAAAGTNRVVNASVLRQDGTNGDSVMVGTTSLVSGVTTWPFAVWCAGIEP